MRVFRLNRPLPTSQRFSSTTNWSWSGSIGLIIVGGVSSIESLTAGAPWAWPSGRTSSLPCDDGRNSTTSSVNGSSGRVRVSVRSSSQANGPG